MLFRSPDRQIEAHLGAQGGDQIVFNGHGFDYTVQDYYLCSFRALSEEYGVREMNSSWVTAESSTKLTCVTPRWGREWHQMNATVKLYEGKNEVEHRHKDTITRCTKIHRQGKVEKGPQVNTDEYSLIYEFYEIYIGVRSYPVPMVSGGTSMGNERLELEVYGMRTNQEFAMMF